MRLTAAERKAIREGLPHMACPKPGEVGACGCPDVYETVEAIIDARVKGGETVPKNTPIRCASCGERATTTIVLEGFRAPVCLRHYNIWVTPNFDGPELVQPVRLATDDELEALL